MEDVRAPEGFDEKDAIFPDWAGSVALGFAVSFLPPVSAQFDKSQSRNFSERQIR